MKTLKYVLGLSLVIVLGVSVSGMISKPADAGMGKMNVGDTVSPFSLKDANGKEHNLADALGKKVIVLDFWNLNCPVSRGYEERLKALYKTFAPKDVVFYAIDSNNTNTVDAIKAYATQNELPYSVLKDEKNVIADQFGANVTPEVFVIGKDKKIQYHGPIDDKQNAAEVKQKLAENALNAVLAGKEVPVKEFKAFGCSIKRAN